MNRRSYACALAFGVLNALMAATAGLAHQLQPDLSPMTTSTLRAAVNMVIIVMMAWRDPLSLFGDLRATLWIRGLFGAVSLISYFEAIARIGVGQAAFLLQTNVIWVALLAPLILKEPLRIRTLLAVAGALTGLVLLAGFDKGISNDLIGRCMGVLSGLSAALAFMAVRRAGTTNSPTVIVFYFTLMSTLGCAGLQLVRPAPWPTRPVIWLLLVGVGAFATAAQLCLTMAYQTGEAAQVAVVTYSAPLFASLLGCVVLGQIPSPAGWWGMALILISGVALPMLSVRRRQSGACAR